MTTQFTVTGENVFQIPALAFAIGMASNAYTLMYSVTGEEGTFKAVEGQTSANDVHTVFAPCGMYYYLDGNTDEVAITY